MLENADRITFVRKLPADAIGGAVNVLIQETQSITLWFTQPGSLTLKKMLSHLSDFCKDRQGVEPTAEYGVGPGLQTTCYYTVAVDEVMGGRVFSYVANECASQLQQWIQTSA